MNETVKIPLTNLKYIKILKLSAVLFMLLAFSLVPVSLILKFLPLNFFNPTLKKFCGCPRPYLHFTWTMKCNHVHGHTQDFYRENLCNYFAACDIKILLTVSYIAECYDQSVACMGKLLERLCKAAKIFGARGKDSE